MRSLLFSIFDVCASTEFAVTLRKQITIAISSDELERMGRVILPFLVE